MEKQYRRNSKASFHREGMGKNEGIRLGHFQLVSLEKRITPKLKKWEGKEMEFKLFSFLASQKVHLVLNQKSSFQLLSFQLLKCFHNANCNKFQRITHQTMVILHKMSRKKKEAATKREYTAQIRSFELPLRC